METLDSKVAEIIKVAIGCTTIDLAGYSDKLKTKFFLFTLAYLRLRLKRQFSDAEKTAVGRVLPSARIFIIMTKVLISVYQELTHRSLIELVCEDFPDMEELKYSEFTLQLDINIEEGNAFRRHMDYRDVKSARFPSSHSWWSVWQSVTAIGGIPIDQLDAHYAETRRKWANYIQKLTDGQK